MFDRLFCIPTVLTLRIKVGPKHTKVGPDHTISGGLVIRASGQCLCPILLYLRPVLVKRASFWKCPGHFKAPVCPCTGILYSFLPIFFYTWPTNCAAFLTLFNIYNMINIISWNTFQVQCTSKTIGKLEQEFFTMKNIGIALSYINADPLILYITDPLSLYITDSLVYYRPS